MFCSTLNNNDPNGNVVEEMKSSSPFCHPSIHSDNGFKDNNIVSLSQNSDIEDDECMTNIDNKMLENLQRLKHIEEYICDQCHNITDQDILHLLKTQVVKRLNYINQPLFHTRKRKPNFINDFVSNIVSVLHLAAFHLDPKKPFVDFLKETLKQSTPPKSSLKLKLYNEIKKAIIDNFIDEQDIDDKNNNANDHDDYSLDNLPLFTPEHINLSRWERRYSILNKINMSRSEQQSHTINVTTS